MFNKSDVSVSLEEYLIIFLLSLTLLYLTKLPTDRAPKARPCVNRAWVSVRGTFSGCLLVHAPARPCVNPCVATVQIVSFDIGYL